MTQTKQQIIEKLHAQIAALEGEIESLRAKLSRKNAGRRPAGRIALTPAQRQWNYRLRKKCDKIENSD